MCNFERKSLKNRFDSYKEGHKKFQIEAREKVKTANKKIFKLKDNERLCHIYHVERKDIAEEQKRLLKKLMTY